MITVPGVDQSDYFRLKVNQFNDRCAWAASGHYNSQSNWESARITPEQKQAFETSIDSIYQDLTEGKITPDEASNKFNNLEYQRAGMCKNDPAAEPFSNDPNTMASNYAELKDEEFRSEVDEYYPSDYIIDCTSKGIAEGVKKGTITSEQAVVLREELIQHRDNLRNLPKPLSAENQKQVDAINSRLEEMHSECGYSMPPDFYGPGQFLPQQNSAGPQQNNSKNSPILTGLAVLALAALALAAFLFLPLALPLLIGIAAVAGVAAGGIVAYRHGPEIMSALNAGAPGTTHQNTSQPDNNVEPDVKNEQELNAENVEPDVKNEQELNAESEEPDVKNEQELNAESDASEVKPEVKPEVDKEPSIPMDKLADVPTQTPGNDLKEALHEIPEASPKAPEKEQQDEYTSSIRPS